jgi:hypothetical protein
MARRAYGMVDAVIHRLNPRTGRTLCQIENNWTRAGALGGKRPIRKFDNLAQHPGRMCVNCTRLARQPATSTAKPADG